MFRASYILATLSLLCCESIAVAIDGPGGETAWNAAEENYQIAEGGRRARIARQLDLNHRLRWFAGYGPAYSYSYPFEPWPYVPGDIWGFRGPAPIEHPIGFESVQTGPNRWEYRPIYANSTPETTHGGAQLRVPAKPQAAAQRPGPSDAAALPAPAPSKPPAGPREF